MHIPCWWELHVTTCSSKQPLSRDRWLIWPHHDSAFLCTCIHFPSSLCFFPPPCFLSSYPLSLPALFNHEEEAMEKIRKETASILDNALLQRGVIKVNCSTCLYIYMYMPDKSYSIRRAHDKTGEEEERVTPIEVRNIYHILLTCFRFACV